MQLRDLLSHEHVVAPLSAETLDEAVRALIGRLATTGALPEDDAVRETLADEVHDLVEIGQRAVLPHARTDVVDGLVCALGIVRDGVEVTGSGIQTRPQIIVLILAPPDTATLYLQTLSSLGRIFRDDALLDRMVQARSGREVLDLPGLRELEIRPQLSARDVMSRDVVNVGPGASVRETVDLMIERDLRAIPVVGEKGEVLGIVSHRDIMRALLPQVPKAGEDEEAAEPARPQTTAVREIMSRSVLCVSEDMGLREVASTMLNKDVEQVPVVTEGTLTGLVTRDAIIRRLFKR